MSAQPQPETEELPKKISVAEYHEMLRKSDVRLEYLDGVVMDMAGRSVLNSEIVAMAGEMPQHNEIAGNVFFEFKGALQGRNCKVYFENIKVSVWATRYRFPDIVALCGDPEFDNQKPPSLLNPQVIIEVLSPSTAEFDKGDKFVEYKQIASLMDYVLIEQDKMQVTHYARQSPIQWTVTDYTKADDRIVLAPLNLDLTLAAIYQEITLPLAEQ